MYEIYNRIPQPIPLLVKGETVMLGAGSTLKIEEKTPQIVNLVNKNMLKIREIKGGK